MRQLFPHLLVLLLISGCADLQVRPEQEPLEPPASSKEALTMADDLAQAGRWSEAIGVLEAAEREYPDDAAVARHRQTMLERWQRRERELEDQIMVGDAENRKHRISVLEQMSIAEPDNLLVTSRRIYWKEVMEGDLEPLVNCGEYHVNTNTPLARRCFRLASGIHATPAVEERLAAVSEQLRLSEQAAAERRLVAEKKERQRKAKVLLDEAKTAIESREYREALDILQKVEELQPENSEVTGLQEAAMSMLSPQVEALVKLGDHLYLDEQLTAAVATWQAALILRPEDEAIMARVDRANTVLNRLDALRRQQNPEPQHAGPQPAQ